MNQDYPVPTGRAEAELIVKKSRFIGHAMPAATREEAMAHLEQARRDYPDARHHCFAYVFGKPGAATSAAMGDDGEPSGTAGRPILNVIEHKGIGDVMVIVIRYFGGIKLGAGGLVRAYSGVTERVLATLALAQYEPRQSLDLELDFALEQPLRHWSEGHGAVLESITYGAQVAVRLSLPMAAVDVFEDFAAAHGIGWVAL